MMRLTYLSFLLLAANLWVAPIGTAWAQPALMDSSQPIEITADELEVFQDKQQAIFTGQVEAIQGKITLNSDKMVVHYASQKTGGSSEGGGNQISRIEVEGNVFLKTAEETARGAKGFYDVDAKLVRLLGNVVLTKQKNEIRGDALEYHLDTGRSKIIALPAKTPASAGGEDAPKKGRVRGVFIPQSGGQ